MRKLTALDPTMMGPEPSWSDPNNQPSLSSALSWYSYSFGKKEAKEFVIDYVKAANRPKAEIELVKSVSERLFVAQMGWIARMITACKFVPDDKTKTFFQNEYRRIIQLAKKDAPVVVEVETPKETQPKVSIQDRILEKAHEEVGDIEGIIDDFVASGCKKSFDIQNYLTNKKLSAVVLKRMCDILLPKSAHLDEVLTSNDPQYKEGYSNFTKPELRRLKEFIDSIIAATNRGAIENKPTRKPRKKKEKPASVLAAKVAFLEEDPETKVRSVRPEKIVGASQVWVYNAKTRVLGVYHASDAKGLSIKGTTLQNFVEATSICKKLRKPEDTLKLVLDAGKIKLKSILPNLSTKESQLTGRINSDTIILKVL